MSKGKTRPFDPAEYLDDNESIAAYMDEALESGKSAFVADARRVVARAEAVAAIRVGLDDMKSGRTRPARKALEDISKRIASKTSSSKS